jgi:hypothetical protein
MNVAREHQSELKFKGKPHSESGLNFNLNRISGSNYNILE